VVWHHALSWVVDATLVPRQRVALEQINRWLFGNPGDLVVPLRERSLELLGDECLFWASDFPHEGIVSMKKAVDEFLERDDIPTAAKRKISYDNPKRLYAL